MVKIEYICLQEIKKLSLWSSFLDPIKAKYPFSLNSVNDGQNYSSWKDIDFFYDKLHPNGLYFKIIYIYIWREDI